MAGHLSQYKNGKSKGQTQLYHFTTGTAPVIDTSKYKLRIVDSASHHKDLLAFLDYSKALFDMKGNIVWYLPNINNIITDNVFIRDLKPTPAGTITFLTPNNVYEIDYDGKVLHCTHNSTDISFDSIEHFHHELTRLSNGHYMVAGNKPALVPVKLMPDTLGAPPMPFVTYIDGKPYRKMPIGTVKEYDTNWNLVWEWVAFDYLKDDTNFIKKDPFFPEDMQPHLNSFYYDEQKQTVYISFRNVHQIVKVSYPSGKVLAKYSGINQDPPLFCGQHSVALNNAGNMILFNNNVWIRHFKPDDRDSYLMEFEEINDSTLKPVWNFSCKIDTNTKSSTAAGGNMIQLGDGCYIACVGMTGRNFIVDKGKKIVWNSIIEKKEEVTNIWVPTEDYRISIIPNHTALEKLIFPN